MFIKGYYTSLKSNVLPFVLSSSLLQNENKLRLFFLDFTTFRLFLFKHYSHTLTGDYMT